MSHGLRRAWYPPRPGRIAAALLLLVAAACGRPPRPAPIPPPPAPAPPPAPPPFVPTDVWTREPGVSLRGEQYTVTVPYLFTRLEVVRIDSAGMLVRCHTCRGAPTGIVDGAKVIDLSAVPSPADAARLELADFALAVREAARRRDVAALRAAMAREFVHTLDGADGPLEAVAAWERRYFGDVDRLPSILDRGIANVTGTQVWAAPPEYAQTLQYRDLRTGFRRDADGWRWIFLVRPGL